MISVKFMDKCPGPRSQSMFAVCCLPCTILSLQKSHSPANNRMIMYNVDPIKRTTVTKKNDGVSLKGRRSGVTHGRGRPQSIG